MQHINHESSGNNEFPQEKNLVENSPSTDDTIPTPHKIGSVVSESPEVKKDRRKNPYLLGDNF